MRDLIIDNLSAHIDQKVVLALVNCYERMISELRKGEFDGCLSAGGKFVENTLRAVEYIRSDAAPAEIKSPAAMVKEIEKCTVLPESVRLLIPRVAYGMIYDIRSKRAAVHVKEIDPRHIDACLAAQAASWIIAEFLRLYHSESEKGVAEAMATLLRVNIPYVETFGDQHVVTRSVPCNIELLLLLAHAAPHGLDRRSLGQSSKYKPPRVTVTIQRLQEDRYVHKDRHGTFHITGPGEAFLAEYLSAGAMHSPPRVKHL